MGQQPLIGPNVFLNKPGTNDLSEAASELASFASVDTEGGAHQQWWPILDRRTGQGGCDSVRRGPRPPRELEQAVVAVFLSCQPIGQKALTQS